MAPATYFAYYFSVLVVEMVAAALNIVMDFYEFLESTKRNNSSRKESIEDLSDAIRKAFKKMSRSTREDVWDILTSKKGKKEIERLILNPNLSLGRIRSLVP